MPKESKNELKPNSDKRITARRCLVERVAVPIATIARLKRNQPGISERGS
jgi:hypothetical protein